MSELAQVQKAIETAQTRMTELFDAQKKEIEANGTVSKQLQADLTTVQEELKTAGTRLFDIEQKLSAGNLDDPATKKSFAAQTAEDLQKSWDGKSSGKVDVKSFDKQLGSGAASAGALIQPQVNPGILMPGLRRLTIRDLLAQGRISSNSLEYVRENVFINSAAPVAEGNLKPESNLTFTKETATVKTIAHWIQASRQVMDDAPMLESYVNNRLLFGLALVEEGKMLNGDGTGDNLLGPNKVGTA